MKYSHEQTDIFLQHLTKLRRLIQEDVGPDRHTECILAACRLHDGHPPHAVALAAELGVPKTTVLRKARVLCSQGLLIPVPCGRRVCFATTAEGDRVLSALGTKMLVEIAKALKKAGVIIPGGALACGCCIAGVCSLMHHVGLPGT